LPRQAAKNENEFQPVQIIQDGDIYSIVCKKWKKYSNWNWKSKRLEFGAPTELSRNTYLPKTLKKVYEPFKKAC
jgi:hypothetical protein